MFTTPIRKSLRLSCLFSATIVSEHDWVNLGESELDSMTTIPCIVMNLMMGARPIFYLVPVTRDLSETSQYSLSPTVVQKCVVMSSQRGHGKPRFLTSRSPELYRFSHPCKGPLDGLYGSSRGMLTLWRQGISSHWRRSFVKVFLCMTVHRPCARLADSVLTGLNFSSLPSNWPQYISDLLETK